MNCLREQCYMFEHLFAGCWRGIGRGFVHENGVLASVAYQTGIWHQGICLVPKRKWGKFAYYFSMERYVIKKIKHKSDERSQVITRWHQTWNSPVLGVGSLHLMQANYLLAISHMVVSFLSRPRGQGEFTVWFMSCCCPCNIVSWHIMPHHNDTTLHIVYWASKRTFSIISL